MQRNRIRSRSVARPVLPDADDTLKHTLGGTCTGSRGRNEPTPRKELSASRGRLVKNSSGFNLSTTASSDGMARMLRWFALKQKRLYPNLPSAKVPATTIRTPTTDAEGQQFDENDAQAHAQAQAQAEAQREQTDNSTVDLSPCGSGTPKVEGASTGSDHGRRDDICGPSKSTFIPPEFIYVDTSQLWTVEI